MRFSFTKDLKLSGLSQPLLRRRSILNGMLGFSIGAFLWPTAQAAPDSSGSSMEETLRVVVDTLIPADDISPSATHFGVVKFILSEAENNQTFASLLDEGCRWLDEQAGGSFARADETKRIALLQKAEQQDMSLVRPFFTNVRDRTMRHYYAHPEASNGFLGYSGAPQPNGYPDYTNYPKPPPVTPSASR